MSTVVEALAEAVDTLAGVDVDTLTDTELHDVVIGVQRQRARLGAAAAALLARWDTTRVWADDGSRSPAARLARDTNCATSTARRELRRARRLETMPATATAVADGRLSLDHVDLLARANTAARRDVFADHEPSLVEQCTVLRFTDACRMIDYWCRRVDTEHGDDGRDPRDDAHLHASTTTDGTVVIDGVLDPIGGAAFTAELARLEHDLYLTDQRDGVVRTAAQRRAAALVEMARRSTTVTGGRPAKPLFTVLLGDDTFTHLCQLSNGHVITPRHLVPWLTDADLETILFDGPSTVVSVSHRRTFTGAVRRAVEVRDRHCQHPSGCDQPADTCDIDHIIPYTAGGDTSQFNGRLECPTHNRNPDHHDHHALPQPEQPVTPLNQLRARLRWRYLHEDADDDADTADIGDDRTG